MSQNWASQTHVGNVRTNNEDNLLVVSISETLSFAMVADGVGGNASGEVASQMVVDTFARLVDEGKLQVAIENTAIRPQLLNITAHKIHNTIAKQGVAEPEHRGMATTLTGILIDSNTIDLIQIGDSRLYRFRSGNLQQLSEDQTVAQGLLADGKITEQELIEHPDRNVLLQCLGLESSAQPFAPVLTQYDVQAGDKLLLCSDGLTDMATDHDIQAILNQDISPQQTADKLVNLALAGGGKDNITLVVCFA